MTHRRQQSEAAVPPHREYGAGKWRKMKGIATVRLADGTICEAELHWYEAHGIGKKEIKFKKPLFS